jgi:hypothetical protein
LYVLAPFQGLTITRELQPNGLHPVQIVIATHDYLLTNELSLQAEYQTEQAQRAPIRFFSFYRAEDHSVGIQQGDTLADLRQNPIMEEFEALYNREQCLFQQEQPITIPGNT